MLVNETQNRNKIMQNQSSKLCKLQTHLLMNLDACLVWYGSLAPPNQKDLQTRCEGILGMQNQRFHSVRKKDIPQPNKHPRIDFDNLRGHIMNQKHPQQYSEILLSI